MTGGGQDSRSRRN